MEGPSALSELGGSIKRQNGDQSFQAWQLAENFMLSGCSMKEMDDVKANGLSEGLHDCHDCIERLIGFA
jgi:hypothetical protein